MVGHPASHFIFCHGSGDTGFDAGGFLTMDASERMGEFLMKRVVIMVRYSLLCKREAIQGNIGRLILEMLGDAGRPASFTIFTTALGDEKNFFHCNTSKPKVSALPSPKRLRAGRSKAFLVPLLAGPGVLSYSAYAYKKLNDHLSFKSKPSILPRERKGSPGP
jgi:hypothetical protein